MHTQYTTCHPDSPVFLLKCSLYALEHITAAKLVGVVNRRAGTATCCHGYRWNNSSMMALGSREIHLWRETNGANAKRRVKRQGWRSFAPGPFSGPASDPLRSWLISYPVSMSLSQELISQPSGFLIIMSPKIIYQFKIFNKNCAIEVELRRH